MRIRNALPCISLVGFALLGQLGAQEKQPARQPEVPYLPSSNAAVDGMLKLAKVTSSDIVYDLGCGDGRIVIAAARNFGAHAVGIDIDPRRIQEARENAHKAGVDDLVRFEENDLFKADIHQATVVTLFLLWSVNRRLRPKLEAELKPGTRVVSNTFDMDDWKPAKETTVETERPDDYFSKKLFLWIIPERK